MHGLIGLVLAFLIAISLYEGFKDWKQGQLETPAAITHDAPIVYRDLKNQLPSKEEIQKAVAPKIKQAADELKTDLSKDQK